MAKGEESGSPEPATHSTPSGAGCEHGIFEDLFQAFEGRFYGFGKSDGRLLDLGFHDPLGQFTHAVSFRSHRPDDRHAQFLGQGGIVHLESHALGLVKHIERHDHRKAEGRDFESKGQ